MKAAVFAVLVLSLVLGPHALADGRSSPYASMEEFVSSQEYLIYEVFEDGAMCLIDMGLYEDDMPTEWTWEANQEFSRCMGYYGVAMDHIDVFPQETRDDLWWNYTHWTGPAAWLYSACLAKPDEHCGLSAYHGEGIEDFADSLEASVKKLGAIVGKWYRLSFCAVPDRVDAGPCDMAVATIDSHQVLADGQRNPNIDSVLGMHLMVDKGTSCLHSLGWAGTDSSRVPRETSTETQFAIGRCLGMLDAAILHSGGLLPPELYEQQLGLYLVTLRPSLVGYANCLAEVCPDLEARIEAVQTTMWPVYRVLRDVAIDDH